VRSGCYESSATDKSGFSEKEIKMPISKKEIQRLMLENLEEESNPDEMEDPHLVCLWRTGREPSCIFKDYSGRIKI